MKISKRTTDILRNFSGINASMLFRAGNLISTIAPSKKIIASATVDETFDRDFGIYELSKLLGLLSLYNDPDVEVTDKRLVITGDGRRTEFVFSPPESIISGPSSIEMPDVVAEFDLPAPALAQGLKAAGILSLPILEFSTENGQVRFRALDPKNPSSHTVSVDLSPSTADFTCHFRVETFKFIPNDYRVQISSKKIGKFTGDGITYFVASELTETRR